MSDLFHEGVPDEYIIHGCEVMEMANWHTYQVLTKRSEADARLTCEQAVIRAQLRHIWWGVSVENRKHGVPRIEHLRRAVPPCASYPLSRYLKTSEAWT